jgi:hypothetical protein
MHNRSHFSRNVEQDDGVFFDDIQGQNKNHVQSYHQGVGNQNHRPQFGHGPTLSLQKPTFEKDASKKLLTCTNGNYGNNMKRFFGNSQVLNNVSGKGHAAP